MTIEEFLKEEKCFKHLKWVEVIQQENLAVNLDSMYIVEKDKVWCDVIFVDSNGNKRKVGGASYEQIVEKFALLDLSNLSEENKAIWKENIGGEDGVTPNISIGSVTTLNPDQQASVTKTGTITNPIFNFGIPKGEKGDTGEISVITFEVDNDMHLIMQLETNTNLDFALDGNGHLILNN